MVRRSTQRGPLAPNCVRTGDATLELDSVAADSVALAFWSPPYHVGKRYEADMSFADWQTMLRTVIAQHFRVIQPGGFLAINIADILAFADPEMPRVQAAVPSMRRCAVKIEDIQAVQSAHPTWTRRQVAEHLGCSEQTIQRRLEGNNARGGKRSAQTRVMLVGGLVQQWAHDAGFYLYDRRIWVKDPCWENSQWHSVSYRAVDQFEYVYVFWKPGITEVRRDRLTRDEWANWGSLAVWEIPSVRSNDIHEAQFPKQLASNVIRLYSEPGDVVLDAFMGSGTTGVVAVELGRQYIGIERDVDYAALARRRIAAARPPQPAAA